MSVRRLAEDAVQPAGFAFTEANAAWAESTIRKYPEGRQQSAVIPLLMRAQDQDGWVTKAAIEHIADMLSMPLIRVLEVATFYTQFQLGPVGTRAHIQLCGTTPCMLRGSEALKEVCRRKIHPEPFHRNEAGTLSWEEVECLGACVNAPMVLIFEDAYEDLTPERFEEIIDLFEAGRGNEVEPGPQNGRHLSVPIGGLTTLKGDYDDVAPDARKERSSGPAEGSRPQGSGAGEAVTTPPSSAGRPDTFARETDPSLGVPGKADNGNVSQGRESVESDRLVGEAHRPGSGKTGGAVEGDTGESQRDASEAAQVSGDTPDATGRTEGRRRPKSLVAEDAVVPDRAQVEDSEEPATERGYDTNLAGMDQTGVTKLEGQRRQTSDEGAGAAQPDHFDSQAEQESRSATEADGRPGERPSDLLAAPRGEKDDLRAIRGIGPVIERKLNELGVFHYWQIAAWREVELYWVDDYLNFRGRAVREDWVGQAKAFVADDGR